ncbi:hypothetical protein HB943_16540 [Listeria weihenstephanensis]|uniref:Uncharacterized protein n=1 Tax=Listeria weihenstephanensis TaxID=1006155 RepID=A0A841ZBJ3_9LIST|nr:hypothetical protein [Listeria weihenstephanensis]MBC1502199.1 hypothetical protein [Listeria weihenstephanensis]
MSKYSYGENNGDADEIREPVLEYVIEEQLNLDILERDTNFLRIDKYSGEVPLNLADFEETKLIYNEEEQLLAVLKGELLTCTSFDIVVSFIRTSGLNLLVGALDQLDRLY